VTHKTSGSKALRGDATGRAEWVDGAKTTPLSAQQAARDARGISELSGGAPGGATRNVSIIGAKEISVVRTTTWI